jgi:hypothetical protein
MLQENDSKEFGNKASRQPTLLVGKVGEATICIQCLVDNISHMSAAVKWGPCATGRTDKSNGRQYRSLMFLQFF